MNLHSELRRHLLITILLLAVIGLLIGCATGEKMGSLRPGMSTAEVQSILGRPDGFRTVDGHEVFSYSNRATSGWSWDRADYNVVFRDGKVVEYGAGEVRPGQRPGTIVIFPLRR